MEVRLLNLLEMMAIYDQYLVNDFPKEERKTKQQLKDLYKNERYEAYVMEEEGEIRAYAFFFDITSKVQVLDYFAVTSAKRGQGYGGKMLSWIKEEKREESLILECEDPSFASNTALKVEQERRIAFYLRHGLILSSVKVDVVGVHYVLLFFNKDQVNAPFQRELEETYKDFNKQLNREDRQ